MPDQHQLTEPREQDSGWTVAKGLTKRILSMTLAEVEDVNQEGMLKWAQKLLHRP